MGDINVGSVSSVYNTINTGLTGSADATAAGKSATGASADVAAVYEKSAVEEKRQRIRSTR